MDLYKNGVPKQTQGIYRKNVLLQIDDTMAEWLRRRMQVPLGSARAGSNPARVAIFFACDQNNKI